MPAHNPEDRKRLAEAAALARLKFVDDRRGMTVAARRKFDERFEREVDPEGRLAPDERARRADYARREYFLRLALKSAKSRRERAGR